MKIRPLPEIDLARIAPQPDDMKRKSLEQMRDGRPPFSYRPVRSCLADIFNVQPEMFGPTAPTDWSVIDEVLKRRCGTEDELLNNRRVARGLFEFAQSGQVTGRRHDFFPLQLGAGQKVTYWLPMILAVEDRPHAVFIEPRRSRGLTKEGRRFAFSMMHERIRAVDEDFAGVSALLSSGSLMAMIKGVPFACSRMRASIFTRLTSWKRWWPQPIASGRTFVPNVSAKHAGARVPVRCFECL